MSAAAKPERIAVEVAIDSVGGAAAAEASGADRLELCLALELGGLTPTPGLLDRVRDRVRLPVVAMLRPRAGDFLYDEAEFAVMRADLEGLLAGGVAGVVTGVLRADGQLDVPRMRELVAAAAPAPITCHRAFDLVPDQGRALDQLIDLGVARVLTSGRHRTAPLGADAIRELVERAAGRIAIMAGAGVRSGNVRELIRRSGVTEVHLSASTFRPSAMRRHGDDVAMATATPPDEGTLRCTDGDEVAAVVAACAAR